MKVLLAVGETNRGGTETWLLHIARQLQGRCQLDFLVHTDSEGAYDGQLLALGARIVPCRNPRNPIAYGFEFIRLLRKFGPYDVVHSHMQCYSAWILLLSWLGGVQVRIAHSHTDLRTTYEGTGFARRLYIRVARKLLGVFSTGYFATSAAAAVSLFGEGCMKDPRFRLHLSCVDLAPFAHAQDRDTVRRSLGLPDDAIVIGHVGSFRPEKNHEFALLVAAELARLSPRYRFLFKGSGDLKSRIQEQVIRMGLEQCCLFLPADDDVPRVLRGAVDLFLFPSLLEGLGLAAVEAQAAGLRCFLSDAVPSEAVVVPELVTCLALKDGAAKWASAIHHAAALKPSITAEQALERVLMSGFDIRQNANSLANAYADLSAA